MNRECPACKKANIAPEKIYPSPYIFTTDMAWTPYIDAIGFHSHDPNYHTQDFKCSNGHEWRETWMKPCPCGWPNRGYSRTMADRAKGART